MGTRAVPRELADRTVETFTSGDLMREGTRPVGDLRMSATVRPFGPVLVVAASGVGSEIERRPLQPGSPTIDLIFVERGEFTYLHDGAWLTSHGPLMIAPSGLPLRVRFLTPWTFLIARIQREPLLPHLSAVPDRAMVYSRLSVPEQAMHGYLASLMDADAEVSVSESGIVSKMLIEMAGLVLRDRHPGAEVRPGSASARLWSQALGVIARRGADPTLDPTGIAGEAGCSLRRLQTVFAQAGTTVAREIRRERARIARSLLQDPGRADHGTADIAHEAGFGSSTSMWRALSDVYGAGPKELRRQGVAGEPG